VRIINGGRSRLSQKSPRTSSSEELRFACVPAPQTEADRDADPRQEASLLLNAIPADDAFRRSVSLA
jgi:hypothetical protein